jgi:hypothetical protein
MITIEIVIFAMISLSIIVGLNRNLHRWALALQHFYIRSMERAFGNGDMWRRPRSLFYCKIHIVFLAILAILIAFNFCFGTIYL